jgi:hypothetical protein
VLAQPPTPRLAVPAPANALLPDDASKQFADAIAAGLQAQEVPAVADQVRKNDWQLVTTAEQRGATVVPVFTVRTPTGEEKGKTEGSPIETQAWAAAAPATLQQSAADAAPKISRLLTSIQHADPNSLYNRIAKVDVTAVTGAPGDGNASLTRQMRTHLGALGPLVQDSANGADFIVQGSVRMVPIARGQQRVEIQWTVTTASGDERGKVTQLNEIPAGSLDHYWADVAVVVATEAAGGVNDVIIRQSGHEPNDSRPAAQGAANPDQTVHGQTQGALVEGQNSGVERPAR